MQLILTPAGGGQPVTLGFPSSTQQGALNVSQMVAPMLPTDVVLVVRNSVLCGVLASVLFAQLGGGTGGSGGGGTTHKTLNFTQRANISLLPLIL